MVDVILHETGHLLLAKIYGNDRHPKAFMQTVWRETYNYFHSIGEDDVYFSSRSQRMRKAEAEVYKKMGEAGW